MKGYRGYFLTKLWWFTITLIAAFMLNFFLPRLMPGDPVAAIVSRLAQGMTNTTGVQAIYEQYAELFGTNKPVLEQFFLYVRNVFRGDFGFSFSQYPRTVADVISSSIWWTVALQFPAIIVGWLIGNTLGALAAYLRKGFDKVLMPISFKMKDFTMQLSHVGAVSTYLFLTSFCVFPGIKINPFFVLDFHWWQSKFCR